MSEPIDQSHAAADIDSVLKLSIKEVAQELIDALGARLTAALGGAQESRRARDWAAGSPPQRPENLRTALQATRSIVAVAGPETAKVWFVGCSSGLDYLAPLSVLSENSAEARTSVLRAAMNFSQR